MTTAVDKKAEAEQILEDLRDAGFPHDWAEEMLRIGFVHTAWRTAHSARLLARLRIAAETGVDALTTPLLDPRYPYAPFVRLDPQETH